jgi:alpha-amylase
MVYSDEIGVAVADMGFKAVLTEGAKHVLGWKSPNFLYCNARNPKLKVLLRNFTLSDDIAFRFSNKDWNEWPLTAEKFANWLNLMEEHQELANIFIDYETFGEHQPAEGGIFDFLGHLPEAIQKNTPFRFMTPSEITEQFQTVGAVQVPYPVSWADEERDLTAWLGNNLQESAFEKLYSLAGRVKNCQDNQLLRDWDYLQSSDHFYYMSTKFFSDGAVHAYFNPYETPYEAFMNYMNILSDFEIRLNACVPEEDDQKLALYVSLHKEREAEVEKLKGENRKLKEKIRKLEGETTKTKAVKKSPAAGAKGSRKTVSGEQKKAAGSRKTEAGEQKKATGSRKTNKPASKTKSKK